MKPEVPLPLDYPVVTPQVEVVRQRALRGVASMAGRELVIKLLALGGWIALARLLEPSLFGLFAISNFAVNVFVLFSEVGLGAALVHKGHEVERRDLDALFRFQLLWVSIAAAGMVAVAPLFEGAYGLPGSGWALAALAGGLVLISLRTVPAIIAQRRLRYGPLVWADVSGQAVYWLVAVSAALLGFGVWSVAWAVLAAGLLGTVVIYARVGWRPALRADWRLRRQDVLFGLAYQSQLASSFTKYMVFPVLGGLAYGPAAVGYVTWAHQLSVVPVQLSQLVSRVGYSAFSRLQEDREALVGMLSATVRWTCKLSFPAFGVVAGLAPQIVEHVYGPKWYPALPTLYLLLASMAVSSVVGVLVSALYSLGRGVAGLRIAVGWAALTWLAALGLFLLGIGFEAFGVAYVVATLAMAGWTLYEMRDLGVLRLLSGVWVPGVSAVMLAVGLHLLAPALVRDFWSLLLVGGIAGAAGVALNLWGERSGKRETGSGKREVQEGYSLQRE